MRSGDRRQQSCHALESVAVRRTSNRRMSIAPASVRSYKFFNETNGYSDLYNLRCFLIFSFIESRISIFLTSLKEFILIEAIKQQTQLIILLTHMELKRITLAEQSDCFLAINPVSA